MSNYFSVAKFKATYAENVPALLGREQWDIVDPGFKLCAPVLTRPPGRPQKNRIRPSAEGGVRRQRKCKRCGGLGHIQKFCTNVVDPAYGEEEQWGAQNAEDHAQNAEEPVAEGAPSARYVFSFSFLFCQNILFKFYNLLSRSPALG